MKKLVSFVLAAVLCMGMATTVAAAPSATYSPIGTAAPVEVKELTAADVEITESEIKDLVGGTIVGEPLYYNIESTVETQWVEFSVSTAKYGDTWVCLAQNDNGSWDPMTVVAFNGYVRVYFTHMCDIVLVQTAVGSGEQNPPAADVSPKTADANMYIVMLAVVALAGAVVATRKVKVNR